MNSNGYNIKVAGASRSKISECVAFGISSKQNVREQQIVANRKLVSSSEGFVAPVSGKEQYLSVAGTHFVQFVKAAINGCKTNVAELQDGSGCLSVQGLAKNDEVFDELINSGWHWIVFSEGAETAWPSLPSFLQYAYNSGNSLYTAKGEMESAMEIATMAKSAPVPVDYESIVQHVRKSQPACSSYLQGQARRVLPAVQH